MSGILKGPLEASRDLIGRVFHSGVRAERQRMEIGLARKVRPAYAFSLVECALGLFTLADAQRRKSWFVYALGASLLTIACGHALLDIRDGKILDLLDEKLS